MQYDKNLRYSYVELKISFAVSTNAVFTRSGGLWASRNFSRIVFWTLCYNALIILEMNLSDFFENLWAAFSIICRATLSTGAPAPKGS